MAHSPELVGAPEFGPLRRALRARLDAAGELAVRGGTPVRRDYLVFGAPCIGEEEISEVVDTLRSGWIGTGPRALRFEEEFAAYVGSKQAVSLNSCTAGLFLSLVARGIGPGDEVITTPLTFAATVNVIEHVGARPIFVDIDRRTLNLEPDAVERAISPRTRAIMAVHFGGLSCELDALLSIAERHGVALIQDAAHAVGSKYRDRMIGAQGTATSFSFYANKNLTTAEGGMVTTSDAMLAERLRLLRLHGMDRDAWRRYATRGLPRFEVVLPGYKCNLPDLAAAIGIHQLRKQERFLTVRERYARIYDEAFRDLPVRFQARPDAAQGRHALHLYVLVLEPGHWAPRDDVVRALQAENIGAAVHYRAVHTEPFYRDRYGWPPAAFPIAHETGEHILTLPMTPGMTEDDVLDVITAVHKVAGRLCHDLAGGRTPLAQAPHSRS